MKNKVDLAIIIAIDYELKNLGFPYEEIQIDNQTYYLIDKKVVLTFSGIGKVNASYKTGLLIKNFIPKQIINFGSAGCTNPQVPIFAVNNATSCRYGDVDVSCDQKYTINQIPYEPKLFHTNLEMFNWLNKILKSFSKLCIINKTAVTVDSFVTSHNLNKFNEMNDSEVGSVDMESCAIAQVCYHYNVPFNCIKIISDNVAIKNNHDAFEMNINELATINKDIVTKILEGVLARHHTNWEKN